MIETASAIIGTVEAKEANTESVIGPDPVSITLRVNGVARILQVEPRMTLAEALRGSLGLTGTKIACNRGACSACTVWLDDVTVCSCMMLAIEVGARNVTTIEGLAVGDKLHPVQTAFVEHDALQCGFCTPGMVMSCAALLEHQLSLIHICSSEFSVSRNVRNVINGPAAPELRCPLTPITGI